MIASLHSVLATQIEQIEAAVTVLEKLVEKSP